MDNKAYLDIVWNTELKNCTKCRLHITRNQVVPGEGSANAPIMIIGQNPGFNEDAQGKPFVGKSGDKLNELLKKLGLNREEVYITNLVKCFTPANRKPELDEQKTCEQYITFEISTIRPNVIIALGDPVIPILTGYKGLVTDAMKCDLMYKNEIPVIACFHPSYLCRNEHTNILDNCVKMISAKLKKYL